MSKELQELYLAKKHLRAAEYVVGTFERLGIDLPSSTDKELISLQEDYVQALKNYADKYNVDNATM